MASTIRAMNCSAADVFAVIADGWLFPTWVVGASRMRDVDESWPAVGSQLHHSFGVWPMLINDMTMVLEWDPPRRAVLQPRGWPLGEARVTMEARPRDTGCVVRMTETVVSGPGALIPGFIADPGIHIRNVEALRRLAFVAEGRFADR
ncbi:hypothetical protein IWX81_001621 [Salinibacterium sp. CAN_S4]|uniref:SRPBCC family protein n=1 Tax=Salinibacterium sp. CAN_S4 TaxID=2787727 RepID=UPI0018EFFCC1